MRAAPDGQGSAAGSAPVPSPIARRRPGRPAGTVLDMASITRAALAVITSKGYDGLTMAALAGTLGVAQSALYNHVASKQDVLLLVEDHLISRVDVSRFGSDTWEEAVGTWAWSYRNVFANHTPLIPVIAVLPVAGAPRTLAMYEAVSKGFLDAGFPPERIVSAIVALESFIFGSAYDASAPADIFNVGSMTGSTPHFRAVVRAQDLMHAGRPADAAFGAGLEALINGLRIQQ
ncbi:TetR family transcriptional regulator [Arthrobacter frigidicola]|nr:TetR family transcriptional regulator [Arthrobacter frigidicola]